MTVMHVLTETPRISHELRHGKTCLKVLFKCKLLSERQKDWPRPFGYDNNKDLKVLKCKLLSETYT